MNWRHPVEYVTVSAEIVYETEHAVRINTLHFNGWVPKSCLSQQTLATMEMHEWNDLEIAKWFVDKEGLE